MKRFSPRFEQLIAGAALFAAFVLMASIFRPRGGAATPPQPIDWSMPRGLERMESAAIESEAGPLLLGELEGRRLLVRIYAGDPAPLYSVFTHDGEPVIEMVEYEGLQSVIDDPLLADRIAEFPGRDMLMHIDPNEAGRR